MLEKKGGSFLQFKTFSPKKGMITLLITFTIFTFLFSAITVSSSQEFNNYDVTASVTEEDHCHIFTRCTIVNKGIGENITKLENVIGTSFSELKVQDEEGDLNFTINLEGFTAILTITTRYAITPGSSYTYFISFSTADPITTSGDIRVFILTLNIIYPAESFVFTVKLPKNAEILEEQQGSVSVPAVSPEAIIIQTDENNIIVVWSETNMTQPLAETYIIRYKLPEEKQNITETLLILLATFALGVVSSLLLVKTIFRKKIAKGEISRVISVILSPDENKIMETIAEAGGEIEQDEIVEKTGFSKAKVSTHLSKLEKRKLIEKKRYGRKNIIKLKEQVTETTIKQE